MQSRSWADTGRGLKKAPGSRRKRAAIAAGASVLSAAAIAGSVLAAQPAGAAVSAPAAKTAAAGSTCYPEVYLYTTDSEGEYGQWTHTCGDVDGGTDRYPLYVGERSFPYHRVWFHNGGATWCYWGQSAKRVPSRVDVPGVDIQVSANTSPCFDS